MRIAIIEDDEITRLELSKLLNTQGYETVLLIDFGNLTDELKQYSIELVLLDINLPYENGYEVCRKIKQVMPVPIIFVTSRDTNADELKSIQVGGIDFITKPYDTLILLEKIKRALQLSNPNNFRELVKKDCTLDLHLSILKYQEQSIELTRNEFRILYYFFMNEDKVISKEELLEKLWNDKYYLDENVLLVNMTRLKKENERNRYCSFIGKYTRKGLETVSFFTFLEEKITEILFQLFFLALVAFLLIFYGVDMLFVVLLVILFISIQGLFQWCLYRKKRNASQHIIDLVDGLEETYYIADVLPKPKEFQNEAYYYALKKACKSMNDEIGKITEEKQDYQEYVESFAHEKKIPIGALSLTFDNTKNYTLKKETDKIFQLVEQMLYYARSENTEKDYFVKQLQLDEVIHNVILKFRHSLMERKTIINIHDIENVIYTDEKWLTFILSQIVQNAIKYFDKQENKLTIYSQDNGTNILLVIEDNGCGIKASDLSRVFEKGFTGSNRNKANATGMGLYLSKKLCDRLGLKLDIASTEKEYTRLTITFPKGTVHNFSE